MAFPPAFLDELRARVGLVQVISRRVKLAKAGREWKGCCPFHNEKSPSFFVNEDKGFYHCFGCGAHGDVIRFIVEQEGLRFPDAVKSLAAEAGIAVPEDDPRAAERAKAQAGLHDVTAAAAAWFAEQLNGLGGAAARRYVDSRGLSAETVRRFGIGYAPDGNRLKAALKALGDDKLVEAGLVGRAEDRDELYDRFRGRLMFPIRDPRGRVVGFGGRIVGEGQPKYLNSPDTPLFDKGRLLYNLDQAGAVARKSLRLFVVEGYMDAIALSQAGIAEAVAPLGTALTERQLELLWRVVPEPVLCFDGDSAGRRAGARAALRALPLLRPGQSLSILTLPEGQDPDDVVRDGGADGFLRLAAGAEPLHRFVWHAVLAEGDTTTPERRAAIKARLAVLAATIENADVREQYKLLWQDAFFTSFGWGRRPAGTPLPVRSAPMRWPSAIVDETHAVLVGLLRFPQVAADDPESVAVLPISNARRARLRDAILGAVAWNPDLDSDALRHTLADDGLGIIIQAAIDSNRLDYSFTSDACAPERGRRMLALKVRSLAALYENHVAKIGFRNDLRELGDHADGGDRVADSARIMASLRDNAAERRRIYDELYEFASEQGPDPDLRVRLRARDVDTDDGEEHRSDDHGRQARHG